MNLTIGTRWVLDQAYYLLVILVLLNIIFGIIIDTFGSLRLDKLQRAEDTLNVCFICGIEKQIFDRASDEPDGFKTHIKLDHNMWNYLYFIFLLWEQDKDDDDGLEQYVRRAIAANEITWFPLHKAIRLDLAASEEEVTLRGIAKNIHSVDITLSKKLDNLRSDMAVVIEQISLASKLDIKHGGDMKAAISDFLKQKLALDNFVEDSTELSDIIMVDGTYEDDASEIDFTSDFFEDINFSNQNDVDFKVLPMNELDDDEDDDNSDDSNDDDDNNEVDQGGGVKLNASLNQFAQQINSLDNNNVVPFNSTDNFFENNVPFSSDVDTSKEKIEEKIVNNEKQIVDTNLGIGNEHKFELISKPDAILLVQRSDDNIETFNNKNDVLINDIHQMNEVERGENFKKIEDKVKNQKNLIKKKLFMKQTIVRSELLLIQIQMT
jgi:hypothetical protein